MNVASALTKHSGTEWLGVVPRHWKLLPLFACFTERDSKNTYGAVARVLSLSYGRIIDRDVESNNGLLPESFDGYNVVEPNDIVLRLTDLQNDQRSLRSGRVLDRGIITSAYVTLAPKENINPGFAAHLLFGYDLIKVFYSLGGGVRQSMKFSDLKHLPICYPPFEEQQAIAEFLDRESAKIDLIIQKQERLIALLGEKRQAVISQAVTKGLDPSVTMKDSGIEWLGAIPSHWTCPPLYSRYQIELGKMLDSDKISGEFLVPYLRNTDVQWDSINLSDLPEMDIHPSQLPRYTVKLGDLLVCEGGEVGRAAVVTSEVSGVGFQKALHRLRPKSSREWPRFMFYICKWASGTEIFSVEGNQSTIVHLTGEKLRKYRFPMPPRTEQIQIAQYLDSACQKFDALTSKAQKSIELMKERRSALISAAVTGKIDVRGVA